MFMLKEHCIHKVQCIYLYLNKFSFLLRNFCEKYNYKKIVRHSVSKYQYSSHGSLLELSAQL